MTAIVVGIPIGKTMTNFHFLVSPIMAPTHYLSFTAVTPRWTMYLKELGGARSAQYVSAAQERKSKRRTDCNTLISMLLPLPLNTTSTLFILRRIARYATTTLLVIDSARSV